MSVRSIMAIGFVSAVAVIGMVNASGSAAADLNQSGLIEERVGHGGSIFHSTTTSTQSSNCEAMAKGPLVEERVGHGGSIFRRQTTDNCELMAGDQTKGPLVEERIGHGGSVYYRQSARQAVN
jgi:hypothetical protein